MKASGGKNPGAPHASRPTRLVERDVLIAPPDILAPLPARPEIGAHLRRPSYALRRVTRSGLLSLRQFFLRWGKIAA